MFNYLISIIMDKKQSSNFFREIKTNFASDVSSGFMVALLALPLSIGIAAASDFPNPLFGVLTAIIGGMVIAPIMGAELTIKGPAAGLIVIVASAVAAFGGGEMGWQMTLGAIVVAGLVQILFGWFKLGKLSDLFPITAVHGMLAAIGGGTKIRTRKVPMRKKIAFGTRREVAIGKRSSVTIGSSSSVTSRSSMSLSARTRRED